MCLRAQVIDGNDIGVGGGRRARVISDDNVGVVRGQGIGDESEGLETTTEATEDRQRAQGIYDNNGGVGRGK